MILVTGAAGKTGKAVVGRWQQGRRRARAGAAAGTGGRAQGTGRGRSQPSAVSRTAALAAAAAADMRAIYHICPNVSRDEVRYARAVAAAALAQGVRRFVYHSVLHPQIEAMPHHWQKMRAEELLLTRLRPDDPAADRLHAKYSRRLARHRRGRRVPHSLSRRHAIKSRRSRRCRGEPPRECSRKPAMPERPMNWSARCR